MMASSDKNRVPLLERPPDENISHLVGRHFFEQLEKPSMKKCKVCYAKNKRTNNGHQIKTTFICKNCPSKPGLHPEECFEIYHTVENYKEDHGC